MSMSEAKGAPGLPTIDVREYGGKGKDGERQSLDRRLFMQLLVVDVPHGSQASRAPDDVGQKLVAQLRERAIDGVVYADANDPRGLGLLTWGEDPSLFVKKVRPLFVDVLAESTLRSDFTMLGRSYSTGHEPDLEDALLRRPVRHVLDERYPWHVWYPLRRTGEFARLDPQEQSHILREHAHIGMAYGAQELAHDVRLACHALDAKDNEFVIGLVGPTLHPLSHLVQSMRRTKQTSEYIQQMGPFFVGWVLGRSGSMPAR